MKEVLMIMGVIALFVLVLLVMMNVIYSLKTLIEKLTLKYRQKHRFDKPPTAKCYCIDCVHHNNETGRCWRLKNWHTDDDWFCWDAEPRKTEEKKK